jgi:hypothetical protein
MLYNGVVIRKRKTVSRLSLSTVSCTVVEDTGGISLHCVILSIFQSPIESQLWQNLENNYTAKTRLVHDA